LIASAPPFDVNAKYSPRQLLLNAASLPLALTRNFKEVGKLIDQRVVTGWLARSSTEAGRNMVRAGRLELPT
jgi:hypothetical protein